MLDPLYDFKFQSFDVTKLKTSFVHVEHFKGYEAKKQKFVRNIPYLFNYLWKHWPTSKSFNIFYPRAGFAPPTKFSMQIIYKSKEQEYTVSKTMLHTCSNIVQLYNEGVADCKFKSEPSSCHQKMRLAHPKNLPETMEFDAREELSWEIFEPLKISACPNQIISYTITDNEYDEPYDAAKYGYLKNWKFKNKPLEPIFIAMICPNCTILVTDPKAIKIYDMATLIVSRMLETKYLYQSTKIDAIVMVTCAPAKPQNLLSLIGYVSAFNFDTWLMFLLALVVTMTACTLGINETPKQIISNYLNAAFTFFAILLRQGISNVMSKWIIGAWLMAAIIIGFYYEGDNVEKMTVPLIPERVDTFEKMFEENFTAYTSHPMEIIVRKYAPELANSRFRFSESMVSPVSIKVFK